MNLLHHKVFFSVAILFSLFCVQPVFARDCSQVISTKKAPGNIYNQTNPLKATPENIAAGKSLYAKDLKPLACHQCHGTNGNGKGMLARGMDPKPRNFACAKMMNEIPDGQLFWITRYGSKGTVMPEYPKFTDDQVWQIVIYLRQLSK